MYIPSSQIAGCPIPFLCESAGPAWPGWLFTGWLALMVGIGLGGILTASLARLGRSGVTLGGQRRDDRPNLLVIDRRSGETIRLGEHIEIVVFGINDQQVRLGIEAPAEVSVRPGEIADRKADEGPGSPS